MFFSKRKKNFLKEQYYQNKSLIQLFSWTFITFSILAEKKIIIKNLNILFIKILIQKFSNCILQKILRKQIFPNRLDKRRKRRCS